MTQSLDLLGQAETALAALRRLLETQAATDAAETPAPAPPAPAQDADHGLQDPTAFFNVLRDGKALGPVLSADEVSGCNAILVACLGFPVAWTAYCLATPVIETNGTMQPINEMGGNAYFTRRYDITGDRPDKAKELGNLMPGDGAKYHGRGYVQLTGHNNYRRAELELGAPLTAQPDLALDPEIAAKIMRRGMQEGWFTGKSLETYLPAVADIHEFSNARRIVNGLDRAVEIATHAMEFQAALQAGGWR